MRVLNQIHIRQAPKLTEGDKWSLEFSNFVESCLDKDSEKRLTAKQLLKHAFFCRNLERSILVEMVLATQKEKEKILEEENPPQDFEEPEFFEPPEVQPITEVVIKGVFSQDEKYVAPGKNSSSGKKKSSRKKEKGHSKKRKSEERRSRDHQPSHPEEQVAFQHTSQETSKAPFVLTPPRPHYLPGCVPRGKQAGAECDVDVQNRKTRVCKPPMRPPQRAPSLKFRESAFIQERSGQNLRKQMHALRLHIQSTQDYGELNCHKMRADVVNQMRQIDPKSYASWYFWQCPELLAQFCQKNCPHVTILDIAQYVRDGAILLKKILTRPSISWLRQPPYCNSSTEQVLSLYWLLMAKAATFDELCPDAVFRIDDPEANLFKFLAATQGCYERISSHFLERFSEIHALHGYQCGLDFGKNLEDVVPGGKKAILFFRLGDGTTIIKGKNSGCPPFWKSEFRAFENARELSKHFSGKKKGKKKKNYGVTKHTEEIPVEFIQIYNLALEILYPSRDNYEGERDFIEYREEMENKPKFLNLDSPQSKRRTASQESDTGSGSDDYIEEEELERNKMKKKLLKYGTQAGLTAMVRLLESHQPANFVTDHNVVPFKFEDIPALIENASRAKRKENRTKIISPKYPSKSSSSVTLAEEQPPRPRSSPPPHPTLSTNINILTLSQSMTTSQASRMKLSPKRELSPTRMTIFTTHATTQSSSTPSSTSSPVSTWITLPTPTEPSPQSLTQPVSQLTHGTTQLITSTVQPTMQPTVQCPVDLSLLQLSMQPLQPFSYPSVQTSTQVLIQPENWIHIQQQKQSRHPPRPLPRIPKHQSPYEIPNPWIILNSTLPNFSPSQTPFNKTLHLEAQNLPALRAVQNSLSYPNQYQISSPHQILYHPNQVQEVHGQTQVQMPYHQVSQTAFQVNPHLPPPRPVHQPVEQQSLRKNTSFDNQLTTQIKKKDVGEKINQLLKALVSLKEEDNTNTKLQQYKDVQPHLLFLKEVLLKDQTRGYKGERRGMEVCIPHPKIWKELRITDTHQNTKMVVTNTKIVRM
eukprot:TRINITY_DN5281_c0_g1_i26.p1 TRINITY_DN5281_c0_g1~~TRINITY_DN5281_c0_g1_i26.p1  ORF type:complete len:1040 (-),score=238.99 TRINITY_DN5281_c0_g1_i26:44-3163(-)